MASIILGRKKHKVREKKYPHQKTYISTSNWMDWVAIRQGDKESSKKEEVKYQSDEIKETEYAQVCFLGD